MRNRKREIEKKGNRQVNICRYKYGNFINGKNSQRIGMLCIFLVEDVQPIGFHDGSRSEV